MLLSVGLQRRSPLPPWCSALPAHEVNEKVLLKPLDAVVVPSDRGLLVVMIVRRLEGCRYLAVPKYVAGEGPWHFMGVSLRRELKSYAPKSIATASKRMLRPLSVWEMVGLESSPLYGVEIPVLRLQAGLVCCSGARAVEELFHRGELSGVDAERALIELTSVLESSFRVTGSTLLMSLRHFSDLDLVFGGLNEVHEALDRIYSLLSRGVISRVNADSIACRMSREAEARGIPVNVALKLVTPWQRFVFRGVEVSVTLMADELREVSERRVFKLSSPPRIVKAICHVDPFQYSLLDFPGVAEAVCEGTRSTLLVVFDGLFVPKLFEGGLFKVRGAEGLLCHASDDCERALYVGVREVSTYLAPM